MIKRCSNKIIALIIIISIAIPAILIHADGTEIIIGIASPEFTELSGSWKDSSIADFDGGKTRYCEEAATAEAEWRPSLTQGDYTVSIYKVRHDLADKDAIIEVHHAEGIETTTIDFTKGNGEWVELGTFPFEEGTEGFVKLIGVSATARTGSVKFATIAPPPEVGPDMDEIESPYKDSINFITSLGIMDAVATHDDPTGTITRAEATAIIMKAMALDGVYQQYETGFSDLPSSHADSGSIGMALEMGIISGFSDGTFRPNEPVSHNQMIKMIVSALGYGVIAERTGTYPYSWLEQATILGVTRGVSVQGDELATREKVAKMLDNAFNVDILKPVGYGNNIEYRSTSNQTLLTERLELEEINGQITANGLMSINGHSTLKDDEVMIGNQRYKVGNTKVADSIGEYVTAYVPNQLTSETIPVIRATRRKGTKSVVTLVNADDVAEDTTITSFSYYPNEARTARARLRIKNNADLIYNGMVMPAWTAQHLQPEIGQVRLIDTTGDGIVDIIFVTSYVNLVVEDASADMHTVYFKFEAPPLNVLKFDPDDSTVNFKIVDPDGRDFGLDRVKEWQIFSVAKSDDGRVIDVVVGILSVTGQIDQVSDELITIDQRSYEISKSLQEKIKSGHMKIPKAGSRGTFYFDYAGKVAAVDDTYSSDRLYGYLIKCAVENNFDTTVQFKILTEKSEITVFNSHSKINFNGVQTTALDVQKALSAGGRQLVQYETNNDGIISAINSSVDYSASPNQPDRFETFSLDVKIPESSPVKYRGGGLNMFQWKYLVKSHTKVFTVPKDPNADDGDFLYSATGSSYFIDNLNYRELEFYDITKDFDISAVVEYKEISFRSIEPVGVINKVSKAISESGEQILMLSMFVQGKEEKHPLKDNDVKALQANLAANPPVVYTITTETVTENFMNPAELRQGDVVQFALNQDNKIERMKVYFRANHKKFDEMDNYGKTLSEYYADLYVGFGTVADILQDGILFDSQTGNPPTSVQRVHIFPPTVLLYEQSTGKISVTSRGELLIGDTVFVQLTGTSPKMFIIYR